MIITVGVLSVILFAMGSMVYAYKFRGNARFESFGEYVRKGWAIFTPMNCLLYLFTEKRARHAIMDLSKFKELEEIQKNWPVIQKEVISLYEQGYFDKTSRAGSEASYDLGFRTFFKYGWSKFYLKWYGYTHESAKKLCPKTVEVLEKVPSVNGAMFSVLPVGSQLTRHLDPVACSLRYHLGLSTPNSDDCFINIDGITYSWRDGEALLFDETYLHYAKNNSNKYRLILMCDVERPTHTLGNFINFCYNGLARLAVVPNIEGDRQGLVNLIFSTLSPIIGGIKKLKQTNKKLYSVVKHSINFTLLVVVVGILVGLFNLLQKLGSLSV